MSYDKQRSERETIMAQRLRAAQNRKLGVGDEDDDLATPEPLVGDAADEYYEPEPPRYGTPPRYAPTTNTGCALPTLYLVLGALVALAMIGFFLNRAAGSIGEAVDSAVPDVAQVLATPTVEIISGAAVVQRIQQLNRLETTSYTVERVIDVSQGSNIPVVGDWLAGDALLLIAHGDVIAGVDLQELDAGDVNVSPDGAQLTVYLPPVQIFSAALDNEKTRVYVRNRGLFAPENKDLETQARLAAESEILAAACEGGIMQRATDDGRRAMEQLLSLLEFDAVEVITAAPGSCVVSGP
ncbi:DUF4230 domain-containing protein [Candidatus Gracilibacteria bacterium]|nr:DUF4230 domain-containing protein [Candidatus Gracilibacteria bacterium]